MIKIQIKSFWGEVLFEYEKENNTIKDTLKEALKARADLSGADLSDADLSDADLSDADLRGADLSAANLRAADLSGADLSDADLSDADLSDADLRGADLSAANLRAANLSGADLSGADLSGAYLSGADLSAANLRAANLSGADLSVIKTDFWAVLLPAKKEILGLKKAIIEGEINGSTYEGRCACLVGTIANVSHIPYDKLNGIKPDSSRPIERFFMGIKEGDTPDTNQFSKIALEWIEEFEMYLNA